MSRFAGIIVMVTWLGAVPLLAADWSEEASSEFTVTVPEPAALVCVLAALAVACRVRRATEGRG